VPRRRRKSLAKRLTRPKGAAKKPWRR
jgi:hypothetical protein